MSDWPPGVIAAGVLIYLAVSYAWFRYIIRIGDDDDGS